MGGVIRGKSEEPMGGKIILEEGLEVSQNAKVIPHDLFNIIINREGVQEKCNFFFKKKNIYIYIYIDRGRK